MSKTNLNRTPSRPNRRPTKNTISSSSLSSISSTRRLSNSNSKNTSTPSYILRKKYLDVIEKTNLEILNAIDNKQSQNNNVDAEIIDEYIFNAINARGGDGSGKKWKMPLNKVDFERFIRSDLQLHTWTTQNTDIFFKYHKSALPNAVDGETMVTLETFNNAILQLYESTAEAKNNEFCVDPVLRKEMSSSRIKAVKRNISVNATAERANLKQKLIEKEKLHKLDEKWKNIENRSLKRRQQNIVSPAKQHAINIFERVMKKLKKKRMKQIGKNIFDLEATFKEIDSSGDGVLNRDELNIAMSRLDVPLNEKELDDFMMVLDPDGSDEKKTKMKFVTDENNRLKKLEQKWKDHDIRQKNKEKKHKIAEENIIRDTLFECFINHVLSNKSWSEYILKKFHQLRLDENLRIPLDHFLNIIIHSNGHGESVSKQTRDAIIQIMAPNKHLNAIDVEDFEFIMRYQAKKRNLKLKSANDFTLNGRENSNGNQYQSDGNKSLRTESIKNGMMYGTAYVMILKGLDLKNSVIQKHPKYGTQSNLNTTINFLFQSKNIEMGNTLKVRVMESVNNKINPDNNKTTGKKDRLLGYAVLPIKEFDNGISNDKWLELKVPANTIKNTKKGKQKKDEDGKYKPMLRVLIRVVQNEIHFRNGKKNQIQSINLIEKYLVECNLNGSNIFMSMSDGLLLFLAHASQQHQQHKTSPESPTFQILASFPLWSCKINADKFDNSTKFTITSSAGEISMVTLMTRNGNEWLREILHSQHEYLQRLDLPTANCMLGVKTLLDIQHSSANGSENPHPWLYHLKSKVSFGPGRLGLELRQRVFQGDDAIGAIIKSFKPGSNGEPGQASKSKKLEISMSLYSCNDIYLYDKTFQTISECLQKEQRPYELTFIPNVNTWKTTFERKFCNNIFFPCVFLNNTNRNPGWMTISKINSTLSFIAVGALNETGLDIRLCDLDAIEVHDMSFIRALHVYTKSKIYRFSSMRFPNVVKQHILEAKYFLQKAQERKVIYSNDKQHGVKNPDDDENKEMEELLENINGSDGKVTKKVEVKPRPPEVKQTPVSALKGRKRRILVEKSRFNAKHDMCSEVTTTIKKVVDSPFLEIKKNSFQVIGIFGKCFGKQNSFYERVEHKTLKHDYCMKILPLKQAISNQMAREIGILEHTMHPYLQRSFALYNTKQSVAILMDYLPKSLRDIVNKGLSPSEELMYGSKIFSAMEYLHSLDILHRCIEIDNVRITGNGIPRIVSFKNSKYLADEHTYTMCGSPEYMSPNRLLGNGHGLDSDLWAMGIFLYELSEKCSPFYDELDSQMYKNIMNCSYKASTSMNVGMQEFISTLFQRPGTIDRASLRKMKVWTKVDWKSVDLNLHTEEHNIANGVIL
eukprot:g543.t1